MADIVTFWLDNKSSSGTRIARLGDQLLVQYRDRFYVVEHGAAQTRGGKPLRYSQSSLPSAWKKLVRDGEVPEAAPLQVVVERAANSRATRKAAPRKTTEVSPLPASIPIAPVTDVSDEGLPKPSKQPKKPASKPSTQSQVAAECPYCTQKHEIPLEKGRSGKPFFFVCSRCSSDFAVRFVQVTVYQAQVAGFK